MIVIYEDNHQLVINKQAGMLTQPSGTDQESVETQAKLWLKEKYQKPGNVFLEAVHRLDKPVSGIVLFAKTSKALSRLQEAMRNKKTQKTYLAAVEGIPAQTETILENYLAHDNHYARIVEKEEKGAKLARLRYRVIETHSHSALVEIELETGRYHQIRLQFSHQGHPILGDAKYGSTHKFMENGIALHHFRLRIPNPITGEWQNFEAPLPNFFSFHY